MASHSSIPAWKTPRTEEPGGLQSIGLQRVGHDRSNLACTHILYTGLPWGFRWNLPAMQETWVRPLSREDPMEKEMATHSNILAWRIPYIW